MYLVSDSDTAAVSDAEKQEAEAEVRGLRVVAVSAGCCLAVAGDSLWSWGQTQQFALQCGPGVPAWAGAAQRGQLQPGSCVMRCEVTPAGVHPR